MARKISGFTLIELVITLAILAIALAIAIPMFARYKVNYQISSEITQIDSDLQFAKYYAITHKLQTTFASSGTSYSIYYTNNNNNNITLKTISIQYPIALNNSITSITFDIHGFATNAQNSPIYIYATSQNQASPNCVNIGYTKIDTGVWQNNVCVSQ